MLSANPLPCCRIVQVCIGLSSAFARFPLVLCAPSAPRQRPCHTSRLCTFAFWNIWHVALPHIKNASPVPPRRYCWDAPIRFDVDFSLVLRTPSKLLERQFFPALHGTSISRLCAPWLTFFIIAHPVLRRNLCTCHKTASLRKSASGEFAHTPFPGTHCL